MTATQERITRIKKIAQNYVDSGDYSSIEWLIYHRGSILDSDKVGYACFDQRHPCQTHQSTASIR